MKINNTGENVKTINNFLNTYPVIDITELPSICSIDGDEFLIAIGWLANKGCISFEIGQNEKIFIRRKKSLATKKTIVINMSGIKENLNNKDDVPIYLILSFLFIWMILSFILY